MNRYYVIVVDGENGKPGTLRNEHEGCLYIYSDLSLAEKKVKNIRPDVNPRIIVLRDILMDPEATDLLNMKR